MKTLSAFFVSAVVVVASAIPASSETILFFSTGRDYLQRGKFALDFREGELFIGFRDGNAIIAPCSGQGEGTIVVPNIFCPLGTTGFIANGDFDGDGLRDDLSFFSISQVIPAILVEPFRPELCELISAPPSSLPRPLGPFVDRGAIIFFNILTANVFQFNVSIYEFARAYAPGQAGRDQMDDEIVFGTYIISFPQLGRPDFPVPLAVSYTPIPEGLNPNARRAEQIDQFRFTSGIFNANGDYLMDNRLTTEISWIGNTVTNTSPATDQLRITIFDENEENVLFPPSGTGVENPDTGEVENGDLAAGSLIIPDPFSQSYFLPPLLSGLESGNVFGERGVFRLRFDRFRGTSAIAVDSSQRLFSFNILFVDSYEGFKIVTFPTGVVEALTAPNADFDQDGQTNINEYGLGTDPTLATSMYPDRIAAVDTEGKVSFNIQKRPNGAAVYRLKVSTDGGLTFRTIGPNDPVWEITQNDDVAYVITTREAADPASFEAEPVVSEVPVRGL